MPKFKSYYTLLKMLAALTDPTHPDSHYVYCLIVNNLGGVLAKIAEHYNNAAELWEALNDLCTQEHVNNYQGNLELWHAFEKLAEETLLEAFTRL